MAAEAPPPEPVAAPVAEAPQLPPPVIVKDVGLKTPESVLYVPDEDVYLVSNVNGPASAVDGNGFISKIAPDGKVIELKWLDGSKPGTKLDAPKGLAIAGNVLYVADIKWVRLFDRKTGKSLGNVGVGGATFLNDVSPNADGKGVWISDSGMKFGDKGAEATSSDGVFLVTNMQAKAVKKDKTMGWPNGLLADENGTWVINYGNNELYYLTKGGKKEQAQNLPKGSLDGIVKAADGSILVSSWEAKAIYQGKPGSEFKEVLSGIESPADIGYDPKRNRVLVPLFMKDELQFHALPGTPASQATLPSTPTPAPAAPATTPPTPAATPQGKAVMPPAPATPAAPPGKTAPAPQAAAPTKATPATPTTPAKPATPAAPAKH
jgi:sugar lactone lactonase YvrE